MSSAAQSLSITMLVAASGLSIVGAFGVSYRDSPGARGFALAMGAAAAWTAVLAINVYPSQFLSVHVSMTLRNGLILLIVLGWAWLATEYIHRERVTPRPELTAIVLFIPLVTVLLTATNPLHYLAIGPETPSAVGGGPQIDWGPWHLVFMAYAFTLSLVPVGLLLRDFRTAHGVRRRQIVLLLAGFLVGFPGANDYLLTGAIEGIPTYVRLSPFTFLLAGGFWSVALFRHQLFGLVPVSRRAVVETVPDPVVVVDHGGTIVDLNSAAIERLGTPESAVGSDLRALRSIAPEVVDRYHDASMRGTIDDMSIEVTVDRNGDEHHYSVRIEPIGDGYTGSIIVFRDVTVSKVYETELEAQRDDMRVLNEVVRHDIRNDLMVVQGHAELLDAYVDGEGRTHVETIRRSADHAVEFTRTARDLSEVMLQQGVGGDGRMALASVLEHQVREIRSAHPGAEVTVDGELADVEVVADEMLETVFRNPLKNAIQHNDEGTPEVVVSTETQDGSVQVRIEDNGPGIPDDQKEAVFGRGEKGLESPGTGIGLYLVRSVVERYGGDVWFEDRIGASSGGSTASERNSPANETVCGVVFVAELPIADSSSVEE